MAWVVTAGTVVSDASLAGDTGITLTPPSVSEGELLLAFQMKDFDDGTFTTPSGWTEYFQHKRVGEQPYQLAVYYKYAGASEGSTTFKHSDTFPEEWSGVIIKLTGDDGTTVPDVTFSAANHTTNSESKPSPNDQAFDSITTATDGALVLAFEGVYLDDITSNEDPSGYSNAFRNVGASEDNRQIQMWYKEVATAGAEAPGAAAYTSSTTTQWSTQVTLALKPEAGGATEHETSGVLDGQNAVIVGSAQHIKIHGTSGVLDGQNAVIAGAASRTTIHATEGVLAGQNAVIVGAAARTRAHATSGVLDGQSAVIDGTAARTRVHATEGVLAGQNAVIVGAADRQDAGATTHETSGVLAGQTAVIIGSATRTRVHATSGELAGQTAVIIGSAHHTKIHATEGVLDGQNAIINGIAAGSIVVGLKKHRGFLQNVGRMMR